ncbi:hypothetical protein HK102_002647 [Quaeritorhiza haematococci]|nr:hypothetical protein HK102_002647 [Quaeritorhiza haematococci]
MSAELATLAGLPPGISIFSKEFVNFIKNASNMMNTFATKDDVKALHETNASKEDLVALRTEMREDMTTLLKPITERINRLVDCADDIRKSLKKRPDLIEDSVVTLHNGLLTLRRELESVSVEPNPRAEQDHASELPEAAAEEEHGTEAPIGGAEEEHGSEAPIGSGTIGVETLASPTPKILGVDADGDNVPSTVTTRRQKPVRRRGAKSKATSAQDTIMSNQLPKPSTVTFPIMGEPSTTRSTAANIPNMTTSSNPVQETPVANAGMTRDADLAREREVEHDVDENVEPFLSPFLTVRARKIPKLTFQARRVDQAKAEADDILSPNVTFRNPKKRKGAFSTAENDVPGSPTSSKRVAHPLKQKTTRAKRPRVR